jgi:uncharacterized membrane protein YkvA (DUF1232 family)
MARGMNGTAATNNGRPTSRRTRDSRGSGRRRAGSVGRFLGLLALLPLAGRAPLYARLLWALVLDERIPASRKAMLAGAVGYVFLGRDVIPDSIPLIGGLDDLVVVAIATDLFLDGVDPDVLAEKLTALGIPRSSYDEDVARVRGLLPGPVRRTIRRLPQALQVAGEAIQNAGLGPRLRGWLDREGSPA